MPNALKELAKAGVSVWLDDLSRPLIETGGLAKLVDDGEIVGITTNPTIFAKAIGAGSGYEDQLRELALRGTAVGERRRDCRAEGRDSKDNTAAKRPTSSHLMCLSYAKKRDGQ